MKKYFLRPMAILIIVVIMVTTSVGFACTTPGRGALSISSDRITVTAVTYGTLHSGAYKNELQITEWAKIYSVTNPSAGTTTTGKRSNSATNKASVTVTHNVGSSNAVNTAYCDWEAKCTATGKVLGDRITKTK